MPGKDQATITISVETQEILKKISEKDARSIPREIDFLARRRLEEINSEAGLQDLIRGVQGIISDGQRKGELGVTPGVVLETEEEMERRLLAEKIREEESPS